MKVDTKELKDKAIAGTRVTAKWLKRATPKAIAYATQGWDNFAKAVEKEQAKLKEEK
jgi:hypothetical protein